MLHKLIVLHGTWGKDPEGFYQFSNDPESFCQRVIGSLATDIPIGDIEWLPFEWEDGNNHDDRISGAQRLAQLLKEQAAPDVALHIIAHSHGGNVALKAIELHLASVQEKLRNDLPDDESAAAGKVLGLCENGLHHASATRAVRELKKVPADTRPDTTFRSEVSRNFLRALNRDTQRLSRRIDRVLEWMAVDREFHRVFSFVTLGTPFYFKRWDVSRLSLFGAWAFGSIAMLLYMLFGVYMIVMIYGGIAALIPGVPWVGFDPTSWPNWLLWASGIFALLATFGAARLEMNPHSNTNVYFDLGAFDHFAGHLDEVKICPALNIHAGLLDEAFLGLSAYPSLHPIVHDNLDKLSVPRVWDFEAPQRRVGVADRIGPRIIRYAWGVVAFVLAVVKTIFFPLRWLVSRVLASVLRSAADSRVKTLSFGLYPREFAESEVSVEARLQQMFRCSDLDVSAHLLELKFDANQEQARFEFLWDQAELDRRWEESAVKEHLSDKTNDEDKKKLLAIVERGREFFGAAGLRHSMYYQNRQVVDAIGAFIKTSR